MSADGPKDVDIHPQNELMGLVEQMRRNLPQILEYMPMVAQLKKAQYDSFLEEGFTQEQALALLKKGMDV